MVVSTIRYLQLRAIIRDPVFTQMLRHFKSVMSEHSLATAPAHQVIWEPPYKYRNIYGEANLWYSWNRYVWFMGILISASCMLTGAFRFYESFIWHNLSAAAVFTVTPAFMVLNTYVSGIFGQAINSLATYRLRRSITITTLALVVVFGITIALLCKCSC